MVANKVRIYMQQVLLEGKISSDNQELGRNLWNPKIHYWVHNILLLFAIISQINPFHALPYFFFQTHSNIILPSATRSSKWPLSFRFSYQKPPLLHECHMLSPSHSPSYLVRNTNHKAPRYAIFTTSSPDRPK